MWGDVGGPVAAASSLAVAPLGGVRAEQPVREARPVAVNTVEGLIGGDRGR